ncbi:hypothetical protein [Niallia sp.]|uniref:hypothetical protein n=1 Tax=Niallia sp. TaxID=2837523 RepID=UPI00289B97D2|nr:hypothetical protein [Niallia sp.]
MISTYENSVFIGAEYTLLEGLELLEKKVFKIKETVKPKATTKSKKKKSGCNCGKKLTK